ncbi:MAG: type transporter [Gemmatimonadetes bacterium]|nr:type transporter [Gemmatimonadota bacterium]
MRGLWELTWLETKIFLREPLGAIGTFIPVAVFVLLGRSLPRVSATSALPGDGVLSPGGVPVLVSMLIAISAVLSLVTIISIYREGGILKRLRATPLRPPTILTAHVLVKLLLTAFTMALMILAGKRYFTTDAHVPLFSFALALLLSAWSILSLGFVIASIVPTARFAQPVGALVLYPMIGLSGIFVPLAQLPPALRALARVLPLTYVVNLLEGIWRNEGWLAHLGDVGALVVTFVVCIAISSRVFRWE